MTPKLVRLAAAGAAVIALAGLGACAKSNDSASTTTAAKGGTTPVALIQEGTLTVCSDIPYKPFEFPDDADPTKFQGYDVDTVQAIAEANGWQTRWIVTPFDGIIAALNAGNCDVIASAMTITDERKEQVEFTNGYFDSEQSLLVKKVDAASLKDLAALAGKSIGVQAGTTGEKYANEHNPGATIVAFPGDTEEFAALTSGQVQALLQDFPVNAQHTTEDDSVEIVQTYPTEEQYGFAVKKEANQALVDALNAGIAKLKADGQLQQIFQKYFPNAPAQN